MSRQNKRFESLATASARRAALLTDPQGKVHLALVSADEAGHRLHVVEFEPEAPLPAPEGFPVAAAGTILDVALTLDRENRLVVAWNQLEAGDATLWYAVRDDRGRWSDPQRFWQLYGSCLNPQFTRDTQGRPWCAFQSDSTGKHHIFLTWLADGVWSFPQRISDGDGHCFCPSLCSFGEGVRVVWDGHIDGRFGLYMREFDAEHKLADREPQGTLIEAEGLLANPAILALDNERSFVVYEAAPKGWGRREDPRKAIKQSRTDRNFLYASRDIHALLLGPEGMARPAGDVNAVLRDAHRSHARGKCHLAGDAAGRIWLAYRQAEPVGPDQTPSHFVQGVTWYEGGQWSKPRLLPESQGPSRMTVAMALAGEQLLIAYAQRTDGPTQIHLAALSGSAKPGQPKPRSYNPLVLTEPKTPQKVRPTLLADAFDSPRLLWGDLHRHTDISACHRWLDGPPLEAMRHALMIQELDFFALTDHAIYLMTPDARAEVFGLAEAFNRPGHFTTFCGYEANFTEGGGHMVVLADHADPQVHQPDTRAELFERLDPNRSLLIPHHPGVTDYGYDWPGHDDALGPVAELYQPYRTAFESAEAPAPPTVWRMQGNEIVDERCLLSAWRAGHKVGVIASSDHQSTGAAFAGVWAEGNTRPAILDALRRRHCFAGSAKIVLAFWADEAFMGDELDLDHDGPVQFSVRLESPGPIESIELLRDGEVIETFKPQGKSRDRCRARRKITPAKGEQFYYLRVALADANMAWSSPIWIRR